MPHSTETYESLSVLPLIGEDASVGTKASKLAAAPTAWASSEQAAFDFRSDYVTSPTLPMLEAIVSTTLQDDVMQEDPTTNNFQAFMADLTGHEASLLVLSGTMGNQVALRAALTEAPYGVLTDHRSHILNMEAGGISTLAGALIQAAVPSNGHHLTLADIQQQATLRHDCYDCPTRVISLENTLSGTIMPLSEVQAISRWARSQSPPIHMHLDGARLWEAAAAGAGTLRDFGACFDSMQLCFTKGVGAPIGSIVVGGAAFVKRAKWMRKMLGGGVRAAGVVAAPARAAVEDVFLGGKLRQGQRTAARIAEHWQGLGGTLQNPTETNMIWLDLEAAGIDRAEFGKLAEEAGIKTMQGRLEGRLVLHYQICEEAVQRLFGLFRQVLKQ